MHGHTWQVGRVAVGVLGGVLVAVRVAVAINIGVRVAVATMMVAVLVAMVGGLPGGKTIDRMRLSGFEPTNSVHTSAGVAPSFKAKPVGFESGKVSGFWPDTGVNLPDWSVRCRRPW